MRKYSRLAPVLPILLSVACSSMQGGQRGSDIDDARARFQAAYSSVDYATVCDMFDPDASFRGKVRPGWTHTRDKIITERYRSPATCTELAQGAARPGARMGTLSIGDTDLFLAPSQAPVPAGAHYVVDVGTFEMRTKPGSQAPRTVGEYVILWTRAGQGWKIKSMDMNP